MSLSSTRKKTSKPFFTVCIFFGLHRYMFPRVQRTFCTSSRAWRRSYVFVSKSHRFTALFVSVFSSILRFCFNVMQTLFFFFFHLFLLGLLSLWVPYFLFYEFKEIKKLLTYVPRNMYFHVHWVGRFCLSTTVKKREAHVLIENY